MNIISKNAIGADNQQETLKNFSSHYFYYSGFFAGEMSCSIIKFSNSNPVGYHFTPDITVTNADINLLKKVNKALMNGNGVISAVKGAYNLSFRGKIKVRKVLNFFDKYPVLTGDLAKNRIRIMQEALQYLEHNRGHKIHQEKTQVMKKYRCELKRNKRENYVSNIFSEPNATMEVIGYFLAGIIDSEGSIGIKKCGNHLSPFIAVAMKDKKIVDLFRKFLNYGNVRLRKDGVYHLEVNSKNEIKKIAKLFLYQYPLQHKKQREKLKKLQRILNDYTPNSLKRSMI